MAEIRKKKGIKSSVKISKLIGHQPNGRKPHPVKQTLTKFNIPSRNVPIHGRSGRVGGRASGSTLFAAGRKMGADTMRGHCPAASETASGEASTGEVAGWVGARGRS